MKEQKKLDEATLGFEPATQLPPAKESAAFNHWAMQPLSQQQLEINTLEVSFSAFHTVEPYGAVFFMNVRDDVRVQERARPSGRDPKTCCVLVAILTICEPLVN